MDDEDEETVNEPRSTIGAQDIISLQTTSHNGFLRYEGALERFIRRTVIFKPFFREAVKWRQRFVVLCEGCMYLYKDEYSRCPMKAFSLAEYNRIQRIQGNEVNERRKKMSFELVPLNATSHCLNFCCATDEERKMWFQRIRKEMERAANVSSQLQSDFDQEEYVSLEKPVKEVSTLPGAHYRQPEKKSKDKTPENKKKDKDVKKAPTKPLPPTPAAEDDTVEDEDPQDDYDTIREDVFDRRPLPELPPEKKAIGKSTRLGEQIKPQKAPKPKPKKMRLYQNTINKTTSFSRSEFEFNSSDRARAEEILEDKQVGTFLVRKSRQDQQEVLSIKTEEGIKEYKIYNKPKGLSIDNKENWFTTTEELLDFYAKHDIPHRVLTLSRGYSSTSDERL